MDERDVQLARPQRVGDARRIHLGDHRLQPGVLTGERHQRPGDDRPGRAREGADPQRSGQPVPGVDQFGGGQLQPLQHRLGMADEVAPGRRQGHPPPGALQQRHPGLPLQHGQLLGDGGRAEGERLGHGGDGAPVGELPEQAQAAYVEHRPSLRFSAQT